MEGADWLERVRGSMAETWRQIATGSEGGSVVERDGLLATVVPATPDRSVFNSVIYARTEALAEALDELAEAYRDAGVRAWTVWVPEEDREAAAMLEAAGHALDAEPRAMGMELENLRPASLEGVEWTDRGDPKVLARINDLAYGYPEGTFAAGIGGAADESPIYLASLDGETVASVMTHDVGDDCEVAFVATLEQARGRGLATALMLQALADARERGCTTTTLQATEMGTPVYSRMGYRDFGALQMWERRE